MTQWFGDSACCNRISPFNLVRQLCPAMNLVRDGFMTFPALCDRPSHCHGAAPERGPVELQFGCQQLTLPAPEPTVRYTANAVRIELNT